MLYIYDNLVHRIQKHLKKHSLKAKVDFRIGKSWHKYRYIQVIPEGISDSIHYEYINHHWELHFEDSQTQEDVERIRQILIKNIESTGSIDWSRWKGRNKGRLVFEEEVSNESFEKIFDELWLTTIQFLQGCPTIAVPAMNTNITTSNASAFIPIQEYYAPDTNIQSVSSIAFDRLTIPPYQRPYKWSIKNVNQLIDDVINFCERGTSEYRLGTLVLHKLSKDPTSEMEIVDGQQRTITLLLLLNELRLNEKFSDLFLPEFCDSIDVFLRRKQFHDSVSRMHIQENINAIRFRMPDFHKKHVRFILDHCSFVIIALYDISEAFQFFDSQNARGKELEPHDLLKAFHLREIPELTDMDRQNITDWERIDPSSLSALFLVLFRVKRWIEAKNGRFFTSNSIDTFKGHSTHQSYLPYQKIYLMADCYTQLYNADISRRLDCQYLEFPHQIDQATINGTLFFDMIRYYAEKSKELPDLLIKYASEISTALNTYKERGRDGDKFTRALFDAALLFYYDKFGIAGIEKAILKIFLWAYSLRLRQYSVQRATMDNYARESNSAFRVIHCAIKPFDLMNWQIPKLKESTIEQSGMKPIRDIFEYYNYIER